MITAEQLFALCPKVKYAGEWARAISLAESEFNISDLAMFMANVIHETQGFTRFVENLNYSSSRLMEVWPARFPSIEIANQYGGQPVKIANKVYSNRMGNGPSESGDGYKYRGRGLAMLTGKLRYCKCSGAIEVDIVSDPDELMDFDTSSRSAGWFWQVNRMSTYADDRDFESVCRLWNTGRPGRMIPAGKGIIGWNERLKIYTRCRKVLNATMR